MYTTAPPEKTPDERPDRDQIADSSAALAYRRLREAILALDLRPGEPLTEARLCDFLGTSRTTVRGALARLVGEGLVRKAGRSCAVAPIDLAEIGQAFAYREVLEVGALRLSAPRLEAGQVAPEALASLRAYAAAEDASLEDYMRGATRFHVELARLSGNELLVRALQDVLARLSRARWLEASGDEGRARARADHLRLLDLLGAGDAEAACAHTEAHLRRSRDRLLAALTDARRGLHARGLAVVL